uniref:GyrI-like domain-containing protein n=1 Tax=Caenorhabditis tropicalis TaxID=1561998 RepID=A0A1I7TTG4_9PELO
MFELAFIAILLAAAVYIFLTLRKNGFFVTVEPSVTTAPKNLEKPLAVYYKYHLGPYQNVMEIIGQAKQLLSSSPAPSTFFGIYYDNPETTDSHFLQSAVGVVFGADGKDFHDEKYAKDLVENGFEKLVLPKVERAVQAVQPSTGGSLSFLALIWFTYSTIRKYISENKLETTYAVEFYSDSDIHVIFPLDDVNEFLVKDYQTIDKLESDAAKKRFDSSEEDSESEPEGTEEPEGDEKDE